MSKKHVKVLKKARKLIAGEEEFVCLALWSVRQTHPKLYTQSIDIECWITESLGPAETVTDWLDMNYFIVLSSDEEERQYRLAWIDSMIPQVKEWK